MTTNDSQTAVTTSRPYCGSRNFFTCTLTDNDSPSFLYFRAKAMLYHSMCDMLLPVPAIAPLESDNEEEI